MTIIGIGAAVLIVAWLLKLTLQVGGFEADMRYIKNKMEAGFSSFEKRMPKNPNEEVVR